MSEPRAARPGGARGARSLIHRAGIAGIAAVMAGAVLSTEACSVLLDWTGYTGGGGGRGSADGGSDGGGGYLLTCGMNQFCARAAPSGWTGPVAFAEVAADAGAPTCGDSYSIAFHGAAGLNVPSAVCECSCSAPTGVTCPMPAVSFFSDPGCAMPCGAPAPLDTSTCVMAPNGCNTLDAGTGVVHLALEVATAVPTGGACSPSTAETLHPATWARRSLECIPTNTPDQGSCSAGAFCLPAAPTSLSFCIGQAGVATQCPSGSGYMSGPFVEYADPLTLAEGRSCSNCGCDPPADAGCSQPTGLLESNCTIPNIPFLPSQCFAENGVKGITAASVTTSGKCTPTGGLAVGTVTPLSSTMSFCCAP